MGSHKYNRLDIVEPVAQFDDGFVYMNGKHFPYTICCQKHIHIGAGSRIAGKSCQTGELRIDPADVEN